MNWRPSKVSSVLGCCSFDDLGNVWLSYLVCPGLSDAVEASTIGSLTLYRETKFIYRLRFCCDSFSTWIFLRSFRHHLRTNCRTETANVEQTEKMMSFIACEISLGSQICESDFWVQIDSIEKPIKSNSVGSGNISHVGLLWKRTCSPGTRLLGGNAHGCCLLTSKKVQKQIQTAHSTCAWKTWRWRWDEQGTNLSP